MTSKIEWTGSTWNPVVGCSIVSPGCTNCYAMKMAARLTAMGVEHYAGTVQKTKAGPVWTGKVTTAPDHIVTAPLRWRKPRVIFVNSMSDLFHDDVPFDVVDRIFAIMALTPQHTYQVLTKRPDRMREYVAGNWQQRLIPHLREVGKVPEGRGVLLKTQNLVLPNVWLGVSVEDQVRADHRRQAMADIAALHWATFASYEPALGPVDWTSWEFLAWLISGGESGPRPSHPDWHRDARDFCADHGIAYFFKQWGSWKEAFHDEDGPKVDLIETDSETADSIMVMFAGRETTFLNADGRSFHGHYENLPAETPWRLMVRAQKRSNGRLLDGVEHNSVPAVSHG